VGLYLAAAQNRARVAGRAYNVGGGPRYRLSLTELIGMLERKLGHRIEVARAPARVGDQPVFYCNVSRAERELGWTPRVSPEEGVDRLLAWIHGSREEIGRFLARKGLRVAAGS
jgi:CDP-paratose 2-epimerase